MNARKRGLQIHRCARALVWTGFAVLHARAFTVLAFTARVVAVGTRSRARELVVNHAVGTQKAAVRLPLSTSTPPSTTDKPSSSTSPSATLPLPGPPTTYREHAHLSKKRQWRPSMRRKTSTPSAPRPATLTSGKAQSLVKILRLSACQKPPTYMATSRLRSVSALEEALHRV